MTAARDIWLLVDKQDTPAGMVPIARLNTKGAADELKRGFDGAYPDNAPHRWLRFTAMPTTRDLPFEQEVN